MKITKLLIITFVFSLLLLPAKSFATELEKMKKNLIGLWEIVEQDNELDHVEYLYFEENGNFSIINQNSKTGLSWEILGKKLNLKTIQSTDAAIVETGFSIIDFGRKKFILHDASGKELTLKRSRKDVRSIEGSLSFRERIALPPQVFEKIEVYANGKPIAVSIMPKEGSIPLDFKVYFLSPEKDDKISLKASIYFGYNKLFETLEPVQVNPVYYDKEPKELSVLLNMAQTENTMEMFITPAAYQSKDQNYTLYLEKDGFGILKTYDTFNVVNWKQINRNHTLELTAIGQDPTYASISSKNELNYTPNQSQKSMPLFQIDNDLKQVEVAMIAQYSEKGGKAYFLDCASKREFVKDISDNVLHQLYLSANKKSGLAIFKSNLSRENQDIVFSIEDSVEFIPDGFCQNNSSMYELENNYWRLVSMNDKPSVVYENQTEQHLMIKENQASGSDGCNNYFMPIDLNGQKITFHQGGSTLKMCPQGEAEAMEFLKTLSSINNYEINGSVLNLKKGDQTLLVFEVTHF